MPIVYVPKYMRDLDYQLLRWLDIKGGKSKIDFDMLDKLDKNPRLIEKALKRLRKDGLVTLDLSESVILEVALTSKAVTFLAEHILGQIKPVKS